jgi:phage tail sheath gpL-like
VVDEFENFRPSFVILSVLYDPPGNASNNGFTNNKSQAVQATIQQTFDSNTQLSFTQTLGQDSDPFQFGIGEAIIFDQQVQASNSFQETLTNGSGVQINSAADPINHYQDRFFLWLNPEFSVAQTGTNTGMFGVRIQQDASGNPQPMQVVDVSVAELLDPTQIPLVKLQPQVIDGVTVPGLSNICAHPTSCTISNACGCVPSDFAAIVQQDPLVFPADQTAAPSTINATRYVKVTGTNPPLLQGPDCQGCPPVLDTFTVNDETVVGNGLQEQQSVGVQLTLTETDKSDGFSLQVQQQQTFTVTDAVSLNNSNGNSHQAAVTLGSSTVACNQHIDIYEDVRYRTLAFLPSAAPVSCLQQQPDFNLVAFPASPNPQTVFAGGSTTFVVSSVAMLGFTGIETLNVNGLPTGAMASFSPSSFSFSSTNTTGNSVLTITALSTTVAGTYTLTVTGTSGSLTHSNTLTLVVKTPDFTLGLSPASQLIVAPGSGKYTISVAPLGPFTSAVSWSAAVVGAPAGITVSPASGSIGGGSGTATVTVTAASTAIAGTYTLQITSASTNPVQNHTLTAAIVVAFAPVISSISPASGSVGAVVTINGSHFGATQGSSTVTFNGTPATPTKWGDTQIVVPVPSGATAGNIVVTVGGLSSNGVNFTVVAPGVGSVTISGFERSKVINPCPTRPCPITIFDAGTVSVTVNGVTSSTGYGQGSTSASLATALASAVNGNVNSFVTASASGSTVTLTAKLVGSATDYSLSASATTNDATNFPGGSFSVATSGSTLTGGSGPTPTPAISGLSPNAGPVGTSVTISGSNFGLTQGSSTVTFNGTAATPSSWSAASIVVPVPAGATTGNVVIVVLGQTSAGVLFTVSPSISSLSPTAGAVGTPVTISGANFGAIQGSGKVIFNGTVATPTSWSPTRIVAPVPVGATTGNVVVTVGGLASNGVSFTVGATPGKGSTTIAGFERSKIINPCPPPRSCPVTIFDSGTVSVTVNGVAVSVSYGQSSTPTTLATALASAVNASTTIPVTATASGGVVSLTAKTAGAATNYSFSCSAATNDATNFPGGSFSCTASGSALTGGTG